MTRNKIDFIQKYSERNYTALLTVTYFVICVKIRDHADKNKCKAYEILKTKHMSGPPHDHVMPGLQDTIQSVNSCSCIKTKQNKNHKNPVLNIKRNLKKHNEEEEEKAAKKNPGEESPTRKNKTSSRLAQYTVY